MKTSLRFAFAGAAALLIAGIALPANAYNCNQVSPFYMAPYSGYGQGCSDGIKYALALGQVWVDYLGLGGAADAVLQSGHVGGYDMTAYVFCSDGELPSNSTTTSSSVGVFCPNGTSGVEGAVGIAN